MTVTVHPNTQFLNVQLPTIDVSPLLGGDLLQGFGKSPTVPRGHRIEEGAWVLPGVASVLDFVSLPGQTLSGYPFGCFESTYGGHLVC